MYCVIDVTYIHVLMNFRYLF